MDMQRHLKRWLTISSLQGMGGSYEGIIVDVIEENVRNPFAKETQRQPVIEFSDGWRIVPNIGMRRDLIDGYGCETDTWVGRRLRIVLHPMAVVPLRYEKAVECLDLSESDVSTSVGVGGSGTQKTTGESR